MESAVKTVTNNADTFSRLFDNVLACITRNDTDDDDDLQAVEETIYKILLYVDGNGGSAEELVAVEEIVYNALLVVMAIRDRTGVAPAPEIRTVAAVLVDRATETCGRDVPEPVLLETRDESAVVIDGEDVQDRRPTAPLIEDGPTACDPDGGKNGDQDSDLSAEGAVEAGALTVEDLAAAPVEPDRPYVAPVGMMSKPRRGRFASAAAWKSVRRAALRLCCAR